MNTPITALRIAGIALMTVAAIFAARQDRIAVAILFAVAALLTAVSVAVQRK